MSDIKAVQDFLLSYQSLEDNRPVWVEMLGEDQPADEYEEGRAQRSFDKQFLRDYLLSIHWNQKPPAPELPPDIIEKTKAKYEEAFSRLVK